MEKITKTGESTHAPKLEYTVWSVVTLDTVLHPSMAGTPRSAVGGHFGTIA